MTCVSAPTRCIIAGNWPHSRCGCSVSICSRRSNSLSDNLSSPYAGARLNGRVPRLRFGPHPPSISRRPFLPLVTPRPRPSPAEHPALSDVPLGSKPSRRSGRGASLSLHPTPPPVVPLLRNTAMCVQRTCTHLALSRVWKGILLSSYFATYCVLRFFPRRSPCSGFVRGVRLGPLCIWSTPFGPLWGWDRFQVTAPRQQSVR